MNSELISRLESRLFLSAAASSPGSILSLRTDNLRQGRHNFADTWHALTTLTKPTSKAVSYLHTNKFDAFKLDEADLRSTLALAPVEFTPAASQPLEVDIPAPDGSTQRFAVVETSVMDPKLAAKFPGIKTYRGQGVDDPTATLRLDLTPLGFHAQVIAPGKTYYIDPYWHLKKTAYAAYWQTDIASKGEDIDLSNDEDIVPDSLRSVPASGMATASAEDAERSSGTQLRTYRTVVACTGEYAAVFGGTVAAAEAGIVTSINRVTGIYETELAIRLSLVANNTAVVFTNASTDPYTNNNGNTMLGQNQTTIDNAIGAANYDIGHVFSTGGGGIATLSCVGQNGIKARGVTGLPNPVGDGFDVDFVSHEMGHQFGGPHTFNTSASSSLSQRSASHAYEPGSGITIMAYAGVTGSNSDLALHSDPYFHGDSFDSIISYVDDSIPRIGTRTSTGNSIPTVNAGADFVIPTGTPFALTASGSDADAGDVLTYDWEQFDLGPAALLTAPDDGQIPLFRDYVPTTSPTRVFPQLSSILAGSSTTAAPFGGVAEQLPTVARPSMDFRVTVRDNRAGGAGVNSDNMFVNVVNTGSAFLITSQNSVVSYPAGSTQTVTWNVAGTTANGINAANVNVLLSTDGGTTFPTTLASNTPNDGTEDITIPNSATTTARIKVVPTNNIFFDINNANFTITASDSTAPTVDIVDVSPDPRTSGVSSIAVNFSEAVTGFDLSDLSLTRDGGANLLTAVNAPTTANNINYTIPNLSSITSISGNYVLTLTAAGSGIIDTSGNPLAGNASDSWTHNLPAWLSASATAASWNSLTKVLTLTGNATVIDDPGVDNPTVNANVAAANLAITPASGRVVHFAALSLTNGATATLTSLGAGRTVANHRVLVINGSNITIDTLSKLDLTDNDLIIDYTGATQLGTFVPMVTAGYNTGNWLGKRITSSVAADPGSFGNFALGIAENSALINKFGDGTGDGSPAAGNAGHGPLFDGQVVDLTTVIIKYTRRVDLDLDGVITSNDASVFNGSYNEGNAATWSTGDLNFNGLFDSNDASIFNGAYNESLPAV